MVKRKARALTRSTKQTGSSDMKRDLKRKALAPGKRRSKSGTIYYENRKNRSDVKGRDTPKKVKKVFKMTVEYAKKRGAMAYRRGDDMIPAKDTVFVRNLRGLKVGQGLPYLKAWNLGYSQELRKKNVKESVRKLDKQLKKIRASKVVAKTKVTKPITKAPQRRSDMRVAKTIAQQLGNGTLRMLGANRLVADNNSLTFFIKGSRKINRIKITLNARDLYDIEFWKQSPTTFTIKTVAKANNVFFDQLHDVIRNKTGLETRMPRVRFLN